MPDEARTDYEKASKSDRTQRRTELIVDKQNQQIDAIIGVDKEHFSSLTELKLDVDGVDSKVESNYSFERTASSQSSITINDIQQNGLLELVISGIINDVVVVSNSTLVGDNTIIKDTTLVVEDGNGNKKYYELSIPNLAQGDKYYWQLLFDDITKTYTPKAKVVRDGGTTINIPNAPYIEFEAGEETFYLEDYNDLVYQVKYAILNDMVGVFATQVQMNTEIKQSAEEVVIEANKYTDDVGEDLQAQINVTAQGIESKVSKGEVISSINQSAEAIKIQAGKIELEGYVTTNGDFQVTNGRLIASNGQFEGTITIRTSDAINVIGNDNLLDVKITNTGVSFYDNNGSYSGMATSVNTGTNRGVGLGDYNGSHLSIYSGMAYFDGSNGVHAYGFHQISLASEKKNIKLYKDNAIKKIKETNIYSFIYKNDETNRERIGFVIGDNHNTAKEIIDNNSIDLYSVVGILWKAIQEQQEEIEKLKEMIK